MPSLPVTITVETGGAEGDPITLVNRTTREAILKFGDVLGTALYADTDFIEDLADGAIVEAFVGGTVRAPPGAASTATIPSDGTPQTITFASENEDANWVYL